MRAFTFVILYLLLSSLLLIAIILFNYKIDGFALFNNNIINKISAHINEGKIIANLLNIDDRSIHKAIIKTKTQKSEIIALGSSRIMGINQENFSSSFFNHGMSGASLDDYFAILGLYSKHSHKLPNTIIFGLDPWILNTNTDSRWLSLKEYAIFFKQKNLKISDTDTQSGQSGQSGQSYFLKVKELLSLNYLLYNLKFISTKQKIIFLNKECHTSFECFFPDGSHKETQKASLASIQETDNLAKQYALSHPIYHLANFSKLNTHDFEKLILFLKDKNIKIVFYLPPYHPIVYHTLSEDKRYINVLKAEKYFYSFATQHKIQIIGSYNPYKIGITKDDFYDGMHLKSKSLQRFFKENLLSLNKKTI